MITEFTKSRIMKCYEIMWEFAEKLDREEAVFMEEEEYNTWIHNLRTAIYRQDIAIPEKIFSEIMEFTTVIETLVLECDKTKIMEGCCCMTECYCEENAEENYDECDEYAIHYARLCRLAHAIADFGMKTLRPYLLEEKKEEN